MRRSALEVSDYSSLPHDDQVWKSYGRHFKPGSDCVKNRRQTRFQLLLSWAEHEIRKWGIMKFIGTQILQTECLILRRFRRGWSHVSKNWASSAENWPMLPGIPSWCRNHWNSIRNCCFPILIQLLQMGHLFKRKPI